MSAITRARREQAKTRQAEYDSLTTEGKIARLDARLGAGVGATRERKRLAS